MTAKPLIVEEWILTEQDQVQRDKILKLRQRYEFLSNRLFFEYEPVKHDNDIDRKELMYRMDDWLSQFSSKSEQIDAFKSLEYIFFAGAREFDRLYICALQEVERWILEIANIDPFTSDKVIKNEISRTWFCPVTDSLRINSFLHINGLHGKKFRPDWLSLKRFADKGKIKRYIGESDIKYLVLLEDFVGTGKQVSGVIEFAASFLDIDILVVPLITCFRGAKKISRQCSQHSNIEFRPIVEMPKNCHVSSKRCETEPKLFDGLRQVMAGHYYKLRRQSGGRELNGKEYGFGKVGSMVVLYSNCPNNVPPMFHRALNNSIALFPRLSRF